MRTRILVLCLAVIAGLGLAGALSCGQTAGTEGAGGREIALPQPETTGGMSLAEAIAKRRSVRDFGAEVPTLAQLSQLAWAAQGITEPTRGFRAAPSAGATYPLELYLLTEDGVFHYQPAGHKLMQRSDVDCRAGLSAAALDQASVATAPLVFVIAGVFARTEARYGERARQYVYMEAGHAAENVLLQAVALGLGAVPVGAFRDAAVAQVLQLPSDQTPLYLIPVGPPR